MALLRQCLQELRLRQGDPHPFLLEYPARSRARDTCTFFVVPPLARRTEALTSQSDTSCSSHYSNPRFTEPA